jgi:hypothetical protein
MSRENLIFLICPLILQLYVGSPVSVSAVG